MITLTDVQLNTWLAQLFWPLTRLLGLMAAAPLLGNLRVPARTRIGLALIVAALVAPSVGGPAGIAPASADGMLVLARELLIGLAMGFAVRITFAAVEFAVPQEVGSIIETPIARLENGQLIAGSL